MVDAQTLTTMFGGIGVGVAAIYYVMILRNSEREKRRQTLMIRMPVMGKEYYESYFSIWNLRDWKTPEEFYEKHGSNPDTIPKIFYLMNIYNTFGQLYTEGLMSMDEVCKIASPYAAIMLFEHFWWIILDNRKNPFGEDMVPDFFVPYERLYREMKRRYPKVSGFEYSVEEEGRLYVENVESKTSKEEFLRLVLK